MNDNVAVKYTDFKQGDTVFSKVFREEVIYLFPLLRSNNHLVMRKGLIIQIDEEDLYQPPLFWLEGKPVFAWETLRYTLQGKEKLGEVMIVKNSVVVFVDGTEVPIEDIYWSDSARYYSADGYLLKWGMKVNVISGDQIFSRVINSFDQDKVIFEGLESPSFAPLKDAFILPPIIFEGSPLRIGDTLYSEKDRQGPEVKNIYENGLRIGEEYFCKNDLHIFSRTPFFWIGKNRVPLPEKEAPKRGTYFWVPNFLEAPYKFIWNDSDTVKKWLESGLVHLTEANADIHKEALISLSAELYQ